MTSLQTRKTQLETRLAELEARLHEIEDVLDDPAPADAEDRASEREDDEVLEDLGNKGLQEIQMIRAALDRIGNGSYGDCVKCGAAISEKRLDLLPYTPFCQGCAV